MEKVHNMRTTGGNAQGQNIQEEFNDRSSSRQLQLQVQDNFNQVQDNFNKVPRTGNKQTCYVMILSCRGISYGIAIFLMTPWQLHHCGSSWYLSSSYLQHVQIKCNKLQEHPKNRAVKNCRQVELQNHDSCENCCIHRPMSPHVSNCMQVTSN